MNEKIKEIATRCNWVDLTGDDNWINIEANKRGYFTEKDLEKFAREIVKECIGVYVTIANGNYVEDTDDYIVAIGKTFLTERKVEE
jgi:hypothetical protein